MPDVKTYRHGRAGRLTLDRPEALNALTEEMICTIEATLHGWRDDPDIDLVILDATGEKATCAGGDIAEMYRTAKMGDFEYGRRFWAREYRLNAKIAEYPKPYVAFMQGYTLGGGVGVTCHGSHRVVDKTSRIGMPECGIGLVPDVGGSWLLSRAPGRTGAYLGITGSHMSPGDAIFAGFADHFIPRSDWEDAKAELAKTGTVAVLKEAMRPPDKSALAGQQDEISKLFAGCDLTRIEARLRDADTPFASAALDRLAGVSPLAAATTLELLARVETVPGLRDALALEYRATWRSAEDGDFVEGIRAAIIDRDRKPDWRFRSASDIETGSVPAMLDPIPGKIDFEGEMK